MDDDARHGPWNFDVPAAVGVYEMTSCMFDNTYTVGYSGGVGWQGTVEAVSWVSDNSIEIPREENWILHGAMLDNGLPPILDARLTSGSNTWPSSASVVMRRLRISGQVGVTQ